MSWQPVKSILRTELSLHEKLVLIALHTYANKQGECWPSVQTLMDDCSLSKSSILRAVRGLEEHGYIERDSATNSRKLARHGGHKKPRGLSEKAIRQFLEN